MNTDHRTQALHQLLQLKLEIQYSNELNKASILNAIQHTIQTLTRKEELPQDQRRYDE